MLRKKDIGLVLYTAYTLGKLCLCICLTIMLLFIIYQSAGYTESFNLVRIAVKDIPKTRPKSGTTL